MTFSLRFTKEMTALTFYRVSKSFSKSTILACLPFAARICHLHTFDSGIAIGVALQAMTVYDFVVSRAACIAFSSARLHVLSPITASVFVTNIDCSSSSIGRSLWTPVSGRRFAELLEGMSISCTNEPAYSTKELALLMILPVSPRCPLVTSKTRSPRWF